MPVSKSITAEPSVVRGTRLLGAALAALLGIGAYNTIAHCCNRVDVTDKLDAVTYYGEGRELEHSGKLAQAIECYTRAVMVNPNFAAAYYGRGEAYCFQAMQGGTPRLYTLAIQDFSRYLKLNPQGSQARVFRAYCYEKLGDHKNARADAGDLVPSSSQPSDLRHALLIVLKHIHGWHTSIVSSLHGNTSAATSAGSTVLGAQERDPADAAARSTAEAHKGRS